MSAMWTDLTHLDISVLDKIIRTVVVYLALIVLLRLAGKRDLAQLNSFDLIVMLLLSNVVQNAIIGPDNFLVRVVRPNNHVAALLEGTTTVLARNGHWIPGALRHVGVRQTDMEAALRR